MRARGMRPLEEIPPVAYPPRTHDWSHAQLHELVRIANVIRRSKAADLETVALGVLFSVKLAAVRAAAKLNAIPESEPDATEDAVVSEDVDEYEDRHAGAPGASGASGVATEAATEPPFSGFWLDPRVSGFE